MYHYLSIFKEDHKDIHVLVWVSAPKWGLLGDNLMDILYTENINFYNHWGLLFDFHSSDWIDDMCFSYSWLSFVC